jgi:hypothetical protein
MKENRPVIVLSRNEYFLLVWFSFFGGGIFGWAATKAIS